MATAAEGETPAAKVSFRLNVEGGDASEEAAARQAADGIHPGLYGRLLSRWFPILFVPPTVPRRHGVNVRRCNLETSLGCGVGV